MKLNDKATQQRTSGPGGAHTCWSMFGARGPLREGEDDGGSGGGGDPPKDPPKPDDKAKGSDKLFTQAELEQHITTRLERDRRERAKGSPSGQQQPPSKSDPTNDSKAAGDSKWIFEFTDTIDQLVEETGAKVTRAQKAKMRDDYERSRPQDPDAWGKSWFELFGLATTKSSPQNPNSQAPKNGGEGSVPDPKNGSGAPISDKGGASGTVLDFEAKLREKPLELTKLDLQRLVEKHGEEKVPALIREAVDRKLSSIKLVANPKRARS